MHLVPPSILIETTTTDKVSGETWGEAFDLRSSSSFPVKLAVKLPISDSDRVSILHQFMYQFRSQILRFTMKLWILCLFIEELGEFVVLWLLNIANYQRFTQRSLRNLRRIHNLCCWGKIMCLELGFSKRKWDLEGRTERFQLIVVLMKTLISVLALIWNMFCISADLDGNLKKMRKLKSMFRCLGIYTIGSLGNSLSLSGVISIVMWLSLCVCNSRLLVLVITIFWIFEQLGKSS